MIGAIESLLTLAGDTLSAAGAAMRHRREGFSEYEAGDFLLAGSGRMECDGPDAADVALAPSTLGFRVRDLPDSSLFTMAAHVIEGWQPILILRGEALAATDLDDFIETLRDRAAQFAAIEADAEHPLLTIAHLGAHLTRSAQSRPE